MNDLEERIKRLEETLGLILRRLENIEKILLVIDADKAEVIRLAIKITTVFSLTPFRAIDIAHNIINIYRTHSITDDISKAIIEALAIKGETTISELTRLVKQIRGKASRRIIAERVRKLHDIGLIAIERKGNRVKVKLKAKPSN